MSNAIAFAVVPEPDIDGYRWWCEECHAFSGHVYRQYSARWRALEHLHLEHDADNRGVYEACAVDATCIARIRADVERGR